VLAHVSSTTRLHDDASNGASTERDAGSGGSVERTESVQSSDAGSHKGVRADTNEGSRTRIYYFGPSTVTVSRIREMTNHAYLTNDITHVLEEETIPKPNADEAVLFEEFFTVGLRMPLHPVLQDILLKFQVQLHQLTPNTIVHLLTYVWAVASFECIPSIDGFARS
jgi:hypothetical protein